jgi:OFA family oxalate/formate antiporter-like MFS transporter
LGWTPPGGSASTILHAREISSKAMLATWQFYVLWFIFFLGASVGLTAIGQASPLISEVSHLGAPMSAGVAVGVMGVFNALGRLGWGGLSDHFDRKLALYGMTAVSIIACVGFLRTGSSFWSVLAGLCLAAFSYGGYLAVMPSLTADYYGQSSIGGNYGLVFSAWGLCGFLVPGYVEGILDRARANHNLAGGYNEVYWTLAALGILVAVLSALLRRPSTRGV